MFIMCSSLVYFCLSFLFFFFFFFFFFSSRRRHTRFDCDWSSDVCSSDLENDHGHDRVQGEVSSSGPTHARGTRSTHGMAVGSGRLGPQVLCALALRSISDEAVKRTGRVAGPRRNRPTSGGASPASSTSGSASKIRLSATSISKRDSTAPRQKWRPPPNARWGALPAKARAGSASGRSRSKRSGSVKRRSSRLAEPRKHRTSAPGGRQPPETSTSALVWRGTMWVGAV